MYSNYNIPQYPRTMQRNNPPYYPNNQYNNGDRFFGGGFLGPFILGGITGSLLTPRYNNPPMYAPAPPIVYYPPAPYPMPYYRSGSTYR